MNHPHLGYQNIDLYLSLTSWFSSQDFFKAAQVDF
jgi:hypothetical protein